MKSIALPFLACFLAFNEASFADTQPSFSHQYLAKESDNILLVSEGDTIDGKVIVLATYKGKIPVGSELSIKELKRFEKKANRTVKPRVLVREKKPPKHSEVSCKLMILFLDSSDKGLVPPATFFTDSDTWLCWIEGNKIYAKIQEMNPGTDTELKEYYTPITGLLEDLQTKPAEQGSAHQSTTRPESKF